MSDRGREENLSDTRCLFPRAQDEAMRVASGRVIDGRVQLDDAELPEGAAVTVLFPEGDETFEADPETERMLLESIAQSERGQTVPLEQVLAELRSRE